MVGFALQLLLTSAASASVGSSARPVRASSTVSAAAGEAAQLLDARLGGQGLEPERLDADPLDGSGRVVLNNGRSSAALSATAAVDG